MKKSWNNLIKIPVEAENDQTNQWTSENYLEKK